MASGLVVSPMVDTLIKTLGSAIWKELGLLWGVKDDIKRLQRLLSNVYSVLDDAERRSRSIDDGAVRKWLKDLKDTAFDADDVLDEFQTEAIRRKMDMRNPMMEKVNRFFSSGNSIAFRFKMSRKIKKLVGRFDEIAEAKAKFHLVERYNTVQHSERETFSFVVESEIFGRNDDKAKLMEWLTDGENDNKDVSILPVVGLGGVGKTTLAQLVYNDEKVKKHFKLQMWVCVGEDFDGKAIAKAILECATKEQCVLSGLEDIHQLLKEKLNEKKYLLVLDDVWNEDALKWERLKLILGGNMEGSKIIVTTRSQRVAEISGTTGSSYKMTVLSDDDNWVVFKNRAFGLGREQETPNLVLIGKEIVKKCGGLPLAAKSLGSLMATKRGEAEWSSVKNSEVWRLGEGNKDILPALQLSYDHLSAQLKRCFAYCSVFPKDFRIKKLKLIQLWVAEGLVQSEEGMHVEDIGNQYFNMLHWRSFFQEEREDEFVGVVSCKMHDLVHDLASFVAKDEFCRVEDGLQSSFPSGCRYLSVSFHGGLLSPTIVENLKEARKLRSLFFFGSFNSEGRGERALWDAISSLTNLRVLYLSDCRICTVDHCVGKLKHLRFLDLSDSQVELLPVSITNLSNMQTLNLRQCRKLRELPRSIQSMSYLRHLDIAGRIPLQSLDSTPCGVYKLRCLKRMPSGLSRLTNLQTLPWFMVGEKSGQLTIGDMQHLNHIKGEVTIYGLENVKDPKDAMKAQLRSKVDLCCLGLCWERSGEEALVGDILENLQPPPSLKYLRIEGYGGSGFPSWLTNGDLFSLFNNLVELVLLSLDRCECLPPLGQLPSLKRLTLSHMKSIMKIGEELYGGKSDIAFSSLKYLALGPASSLEEWSVLKGEMFPCLETLRIDGCPKLTIQPCMPSSIVELIIQDSNEELLAAGEGCCLQGLSNLRNLNIWDMNASKTGWKGLQCLTNLEKMEVVFCHDLKWLPDGIMQLYLPSLRTLKIHDSLKSLGNSVQPPPFFMSLHHLSLTYCIHLTALPNWLSGLTSLESLKFRSCDKLEMLPDGFEHLTGLKKLTVKWSPILEKRCERETGEDWHKISHIPNIRIMYFFLSTLFFFC